MDKQKINEIFANEPDKAKLISDILDEIYLIYPKLLEFATKAELNQEELKLLGRIEQLKLYIDTAKAETKKIQEDLYKLTKDLQEEILNFINNASSLKDLGELPKELSFLNSELQTLKEKIEYFIQSFNIEKLDSYISGLSEDISSLKTLAIDGIYNDIKLLEGKLNELRDAEKDSINKTYYETIIQSINSLKDKTLDISSLENKISSLEESLKATIASKKEDESLEILNRVKSLETELKDIYSNIFSLKEYVKSLNIESILKEADLTSSKKIEDLIQYIESIKSSVEDEIKNLSILLNKLSTTKEIEPTQGETAQILDILEEVNFKLNSTISELDNIINASVITRSELSKIINQKTDELKKYIENAISEISSFQINPEEISQNILKIITTELNSFKENLIQENNKIESIFEELKEQIEKNGEFTRISINQNLESYTKQLKLYLYMSLGLNIILIVLVIALHFIK